MYLKSTATLFALLALSPSMTAQSAIRASRGLNGVDPNSTSNYPSVSESGRYIAFESVASNLVIGDTNAFRDVFVYDRELDITEIVSVGLGGATTNGVSARPAISADGNWVVYRSDANNIVAGDTNGALDVFLYDRATLQTTCVSRGISGATANDSSFEPCISSDGRFVAYSSRANDLVTGDTNGFQDVFLFDRMTGQTTRVSVSSLGAEGEDQSARPAISADGRFVAFDSLAEALVPGDLGEQDIFVHDRLAQSTERVSVDSIGHQADGHSFFPSISGSGRYVAFNSRASDLIASDTNSELDVFVFDRSLRLTRRVSIDSYGIEGNDRSDRPVISGNGNVVAFSSRADNLVPFDLNAKDDIFVHDLTSGVTTRVSRSSLGEEGNDWSEIASISWDGSSVAFRAKATNLIENDLNDSVDVFLYRRLGGQGTNSIYLVGPASVAVGSRAQLEWHTAPANSYYWIARSHANTGSVLGGHSLDLARPISVISSGVNSGQGNGSFLSDPVPAGASGWIVYVEVVARNALSTLFDSNVLSITIQ